MGLQSWTWLTAHTHTHTHTHRVTQALLLRDPCPPLAHAVSLPSPPRGALPTQLHSPLSLVSLTVWGKTKEKINTISCVCMWIWRREWQDERRGDFFPLIEAIGNLKHNYLLPLLVVGWAPPQLFLQEVFGELWDYRSLQINKGLMDVEGNQRQTSAGWCRHDGTVICLLQALLLGATGCLFLCHLLAPLLLLSPSQCPTHSSTSTQLCFLDVHLFDCLGFSPHVLFSCLGVSCFLVFQWQCVSFPLLSILVSYARSLKVQVVGPFPCSLFLSDFHSFPTNIAFSLTKTSWTLVHSFKNLQNSLGFLFLFGPHDPTLTASWLTHRCPQGHTQEAGAHPSFSTLPLQK